MKEAVRRILSATMASTSGNQGEELTKGMVSVVEYMLKMRDREALIDKAVDRTVEIAGRFGGKNITDFLSTYRNEMQQRDIQDLKQISSFKRVVEPGIRERVVEIQNEHATWVEFEKALLAEYMLEDASRMTRHTLMTWIEKRGKNLCASGVYAEFDQKYNRLPSLDQRVLDGDKVLLFLKAVDAKDRRELGNFLEDETQPSGLVADWAAVKKACSRLDKRRQREEETNMESPQSWRMKVPATIEPSKPINNFDKKAMEDSIIEELSKKFEAVSLANFGRRGPKGREAYRCVWCDSFDHSRRECTDLQDAIRKNVVYLDGNMIHSSETRKPLRVNFGRGGLKKIIEEEDARHVEAMHYAASAGIRVGRENLKTIKPGVGFWPTVFECEKKGKIDLEDLKLANRNVRRVTGWSDPIDDKTSFAEVVCDNYEALVEEKRKRTDEEDGTPKRHNTRNARKEGQAQPMPQKEVGETSMKTGGSSQPSRMEVEESMKKGKERAAPAYKLRSDIEQKTDLRKVLEEKVLDSHVDLTLRELLGIAKKEFHDTIVDLIKRKRQQSDEEEVKTSAITMARSEEEEEEVMADSHYSRPHWARATTETPVKIGDKKETVVALIDHGSEINLMSTEFYKKGRWPINTNHGWKIRAATKATEDLYGACPNVKVTIGDVEIDQHFFVQDSASHPVILGQPYITSSRMETKVFDNGGAFARVKSLDNQRSVQFLTVRANHERNRDSLGGESSDF